MNFEIEEILHHGGAFINVFVERLLLKKANVKNFLLSSMGTKVGLIILRKS